MWEELEREMLRAHEKHCKIMCKIGIGTAFPPAHFL